MRRRNLQFIAAFVVSAFIASLAAFMPACRIQNPHAVSPPASTLIYPKTKKLDVVDDYFGIKVPDPYRWLEDDNSRETKEWVEAENKVTFGYLGKIPFREKIRHRLLDIYDYPRYGSPFRAGEYYFFYKNDGLQNQSVIYIQRGLDGKPEVFLDPNKLSPDGTVVEYISGISKDDRYVTVSRSEAGSDWSEMKVIEIATRKELPDHLKWIKFSGSSWYGNGFFYSGYDKPKEGEELSGKNEYQKIFYHSLGDPQEKDILIYEDKSHPFRYHSADVTEDSKYLFLYVSEGTRGNELSYKELGGKGVDWKDSPFIPLIKGFENDTYVIDNVRDGFLLYTNTDAPNYRVVLMDPLNPGEEHWKNIIAEKGEVLSGISSTGGYLFSSYLKDAYTHIYQHRLTGEWIKEIGLPTVGTASGFYGKRDEKILFYVFESFTYPPVIFKYDLRTGKSDLLRKSEVRFRPGDYEAKQVFCTSKDGTRVPLFIVHRKGIRMNGKNPTLLYGYGGFNASMTPGFSVSKMILLENGGIYAEACLRGGGEYGENWHRAGMLLKKQNVFDDFIAAAEYLIRESYTSKEYLAINGASNGGLLVGACMTQRPDLFKVAFPQVGVMDMLRYHKFTVGQGWAVEYGSSDDEVNFRNLYSYSPLHNIKEASYPATLIMTADHDDRVVPAHSFKFAATLQEKQHGSNPVLIRIETRSGHGSSNVTKMIDALTDIWSFMFYNMGVKVIY